MNTAEVKILNTTQSTKQTTTNTTNKDGVKFSDELKDLKKVSKEEKKEAKSENIKKEEQQQDVKEVKTSKAENDVSGEQNIQNKQNSEPEAVNEKQKSFDFALQDMNQVVQKLNSREGKNDQKQVINITNENDNAGLEFKTQEENFFTTDVQLKVNQANEKRAEELKIPELNADKQDINNVEQPEQPELFVEKQDEMKVEQPEQPELFVEKQEKKKAEQLEQPKQPELFAEDQEEKKVEQPKQPELFVEKQDEMKAEQLEQPKQPELFAEDQEEKKAEQLEQPKQPELFAEDQDEMKVEQPEQPELFVEKQEKKKAEQLEQPKQPELFVEKQEDRSVEQFEQTETDAKKEEKRTESLKKSNIFADKKEEGEELINNNDMNISELKDVQPQMNPNMNFSGDGQPFSSFMNDNNQSSEKTRLSATVRDLEEEAAVLSTMAENIAIANKNKVLSSKEPNKPEIDAVTELAIKNISDTEIDSVTPKQKVVTTENEVKKVDVKTGIKVDTIVKYDNVIMNEADVEVFANLVQNGEVNMNNLAPEAAHKAVHVSKTLADMLAKSMENNQPLRIDFDNNISVIIKISRDGKLTADFLPSSQVAEAYLKENLPLLKQRFDENNIQYDELNQRERERRQEQRRKGRDNE